MKKNESIEDAYTAFDIEWIGTHEPITDLSTIRTMRKSMGGT